jgi:hypothetical protein
MRTAGMFHRFGEVRVALIATVLALTAPLAAAGPAAAIIGGQVDATTHRNVGAVDIRLARAPVVGSGTLISPTVFLTAGHVTSFFDRAGQTRARVTFDPVVSESGTWYWGTVHTNPAYVSGLQDDPKDLGVIVFDAPIPGITPASLPSAGLLDQLGAQGLSAASYTKVGYGVAAFLGGPYGPGVPYPYPDFGSAGTRKVEQLSAMSLTPGWFRGHQVDGTACYGDSGGPTFLGGTGVVVGITITSGNLELCSADGWDMRLDTAAHRAFIGQYVTLP